jgi:hypothetical protein
MGNKVMVGSRFRIIPGSPAIDNEGLRLEISLK